MKKRIVVGYFERGEVDVEIELKDKDGKGPVLSISGNVWLPSKRDIIAGGQMEDSLLGYLDEYVLLPGVKTLAEQKAKLTRLIEIWKRWHLNDMRAGCEHQREINTQEKLSVTSYTWGDEYHKQRRGAETGTLNDVQYAAFREATRRVYAVTIGFNTPKYETPEIKELLSLGLIKVEKTEEKTAGWVSHLEHPLGLLGKTCDVCGYKYGSAWVYEPLPAEVVAEIESWING